MSKSVDTLDVIHEKDLKDPENHVLQLRATDEGDSMRLLLTPRGKSSFAIFGGDFASLIPPAQCKQYLELIQSPDDFVRLSEQLRITLRDALFKGL